MRQDGIRTMEVEKDEYEKGKYLMPELYNQPPEKGIFYNGNENQPKNLTPEKSVTNQVLSVKAEAVKESAELKKK